MPRGTNPCRAAKPYNAAHDGEVEVGLPGPLAHGVVEPGDLRRRDAFRGALAEVRHELVAEQGGIRLRGANDGLVSLPVIATFLQASAFPGSTSARPPACGAMPVAGRQASQQRRIEVVGSADDLFSNKLLCRPPPSKAGGPRRAETTAGALG